MLLVSGSMDTSIKLMKFKGYGVEDGSDGTQTAELDLEMKLGNHDGLVRSVSFDQFG
jgi:hypothetical protein